MFIRLNNKIINIITTVLLIVIFFVFVYSEIGQYGYEGDNPSSHDYCEIVKDATVRITKFNSHDFLKLKINKLFYSENLSGINRYADYYDKIKPIQIKNPLHTIDIFLFDESFLI